jgi:hypothetical protein
MQIANCKLGIGISQFAICNLQFAIIRIVVQVFVVTALGSVANLIVLSGPSGVGK